METQTAIHGKKKIVYGVEPAKDSIRMRSFNCLAPLYYVERARKNVPIKAVAGRKGSYWLGWMVKRS